MIQKIKKFIVVGIVGLTLAAPSVVPAFAGVASAGTATNNGITSSLCSGSQTASGSSGSCTSTEANGSIQTIATKVVNIFSLIVGIVAVIMIIYGGFRYITSGGDSGKVSSAKNSLIYAIVGLIIVAIAQLIVNVVLTTVNKTGLN